MTAPGRGGGGGGSRRGGLGGARRPAAARRAPSCEARAARAARCRGAPSKLEAARRGAGRWRRRDGRRLRRKLPASAKADAQTAPGLAAARAAVLTATLASPVAARPSACTRTPASRAPSCAGSSATSSTRSAPCRCPREWLELFARPPTAPCAGASTRWTASQPSPRSSSSREGGGGAHARFGCQFFPYDTEFTHLLQALNMSEARAALREGQRPWYIGWSNCEESVARELRRHYGRPYFLPPNAEPTRLDWIFMGSPGYGARMH
ncbi:F-box protein At5g06550, partial [Gryllus bimaculatus]